MKTMPMVLFLVLLTAFCVAPVQAFPPSCGDGKCIDCHKLSTQEANSLLKEGIDRILKIEPAEVPGLWVVEVEKNKQRFPLYIDFTKQFVFTGNVIRLKDKQNLTAQRMADLNRIDVSKIPVENAILLGRKTARTKAIVITDPDCPFCKRLHEELKEVVRRDPDIAFHIKLFPLKMHPNAYNVSKAVMCSKSPLEALESHFEGKKVPPAPVPCSTKALDAGIAAIQKVEINSTPVLVLPNGVVLPGFKNANDILALLGSKAAPSK